MHRFLQSRRARFHWAFAIVLAIGVSWPIALLITDPSGQRWSWNWFKNDLAHSVFHILLLPPVAGLVTATFSLERFRSLSVATRRVTAVLLFVLLVLPIPLVWSNKDVQPRAPFMMRGRDAQCEAYSLDHCLRSWTDSPATDLPCQPAAQEQLQKLRNAKPPIYSSPQADPDKARKEATTYRRRAGFNTYVAETAATYDGARPTANHWLTIVLTYVAIAIWVFLLWLLVLAGLRKEIFSKDDRSGLTVAFIFASAYLPLGVYSDWYQHFYSFGYLAENTLKIIAISAVTAALVLIMVFIGDPRKVLPWTAGITAVGSALTGIIYPDVLVDFAHAIDEMGALAFIAFLVPLTIAAAVLADAYVREGKQRRATATGH